MTGATGPMPPTVFEVQMQTQTAASASVANYIVDGYADSSYNIASYIVAAPTLTATRMYVVLRVAPGTGGSRQFQLVKNGVATAMTCTVSAAGTVANDTAHPVTFVSGDTWAVLTTPAGGPASSNVAVSIAFAN